MASNSPPIQDMPPQGGYSKINFARVPAKRLFNGFQMIAGVLTAHGIAMYIFWNYTRPLRRMEELEMRSASIAIYPFLKAERDRSLLLQLRRNRESEAELMKDVEGWEVGKWQGEPIYKTVKSDEWFDPHYEEYFVHSPPSDFKEHNYILYRR